MKIICIGRNYSEHITEMKSERPDAPVFFLKPDTALLVKNRPFYIPDFTNDLHHEIEVVYKIGKVGKSIHPKFAHEYIDAIALGIDFTARDLQANCKKKGLPWEIAKAFDYSAPISEFIPIDQIEDIDNISFHLKKNDEIVQKGNTSQMLFSSRELISYLSKFITLKMGDLIFTGTPSGVGPVAIGDRLSGYIEGQEMINFQIK